MIRAASVITLLSVIASAFGASSAVADEEAAWAALKRGGHVALMRHATAPGLGDPANFALGDCSTQRNLNDAGRAEARAVGDRFRAEGVAVAEVRTSQWCRARDTAAETKLGPVTDDPRLNSFFADEDRAAGAEGSKAAVRDAVRPGSTAVLVTHQVNVTAATGVFPASGEIVVVTVDGDEIRVVGRLAP